MWAEFDQFAAWPPAAVATVVAALVAAGVTGAAAALGLVWGVVRWRRDVVREQRDRAWSRFVWTVDQACATDVGRSEVGRLAAKAMYDMESLGADDRRIGRLVLGRITGEDH